MPRPSRRRDPARPAPGGRRPTGRSPSPAHASRSAPTARALVERALSAADAARALGGVIARRDDAALAEAPSTGCPQRRGQHGIPVTVKDVIDVADMPGLVSGVASTEATPAPWRCCAAEAIVVWVATHEFALGVTTPQARNRDPSRIPGGSSGGSASRCPPASGSPRSAPTRASIGCPPRCAAWWG